MGRPAAAHDRWLSREAGRAGVDLPVPVLPGEKAYAMQTPLLETYTEGPYDAQKAFVILEHESLPKFAASEINIRYRRSNTDEKWQTQKTDPSVETTKLTEFDEGTEYEFQMQIVTARGTASEWTSAVLFTTAKDPYAPAKPEGVQYTGFEPTYGNVSQGKLEWRKPPERDYKTTHVQARYDTGEWPEFEFQVPETITYPANCLWWINETYPAPFDAFWIRLTHEDHSGNLSEVFEAGPYPLLGRTLGAASNNGSTSGLVFGPAFSAHAGAVDDEPDHDPDDPEGGGTSDPIPYVPGPDSAGEPSGNAFLVSENFTAAKIPSDAKPLYDSAFAYLNNQTKAMKEQVIAGSKDSPGGKRVDQYALRRIRGHLHICMILLDATGDPKLLGIILDMWNSLIAKAETSWYPGFKSSLNPQINGQYIEMKGMRRFNYYNLARKSFSEFISAGGYTNRYHLESDLHMDYCVQLRYLFWLHQDYSPAVLSAYRNVSDYHDGLIEQRKLFSLDDYPSKPVWWWGKPLRHCTDARYSETFFMEKMGHSGWAEQKKQFYDWISADIEYLSHQDGYELYGAPHGVQQRYKAQGASIPKHDIFQDTTYTGSSFPSAEIMCRAGSDFFTPKMLKAIGHTIDQGIFYGGYGTGKISGTIGGNGQNTRNFAPRTGPRIPSRWRSIDGQGLLSYEVTRNISTVPMWRVMNSEMDAGLRKVQALEDNSSRRGAMLTLFLAKIGGHL